MEFNGSILPPQMPTWKCCPDLTHLFFRLLTKLSMVISGMRMKSPSPTVVWSAMMIKMPSLVSPSTTLPAVTTGQVSAERSTSRPPWLRSHLNWGGEGGGSFLGSGHLTGRESGPLPHCCKLEPADYSREPHRRFNRRHDDPASQLHISFIIIVFHGSQIRTLDSSLQKSVLAKFHPQITN